MELILQGKHESVTHQIYIVIGDIASSLHIPELDYLFEKIKSLPYASYDFQILTLVRIFTFHAITANTNVRTCNLNSLKVFRLRRRSGMV